MSRTENVELAVVCLLEDGGRVLLQNRKKEDWHGWALPGGHVEPGESMQNAVIREMHEETGLLIEHPVLCGLKDWMREDGTRFIVALYRADRFSGELNSSEEGRVFWIEREEFAKLNTIWGMKDVLRVCDEAEYSEMFYSEEKEGWVLLG